AADVFALPFPSVAFVKLPPTASVAPPIALDAVHGRSRTLFMKSGTGPPLHSAIGVKKRAAVMPSAPIPITPAAAYGSSWPPMAERMSSSDRPPDGVAPAIGPGARMPARVSCVPTSVSWVTGADALAELAACDTTVDAAPADEAASWTFAVDAAIPFVPPPSVPAAWPVTLPAVPFAVSTTECTVWLAPL